MRILTLAMLTAALPLAACHGHGFSGDTTPGIKGSGSGDTRSYQVADFTAVDLRGSDDVEVKTGAGFAVRAEGPSAELDRLKITRTGDTLRIGRIDDGGFHWNSGNHPVKVFVTLPRLAAASIAGSGDMSVDKVEGASFSGSTAGSGNLDIAAVAVDSVDLSIAGSGDMRLKGAAKQLRIDIAGSGGVDAAGLKAQGAKVSIAGSGNARADVTGPASVSVMGSGDVDLGAGAKCSTSKMGSGEVHCGS
ncbi:head GIN domain-containing protein [Sphingomonas sp. AR_OL41]|uniref:head GIN domain-containing protein n=1 Tax=Sphingomonas sp. AR_OL41 TaxID=3042729 RepID=UPI00248037B0|nr:head GIN domain-containing protein [Sphingomonas sp. AR_OL41]MDH7975423.1 head GIN domain-containing protein [Sphingomonas sp. AR_OL41]